MGNFAVRGVVGTLALIAGCGVVDKLASQIDTPDLAEELGVPVGAAIGEQCITDDDCISGRSCVDGACAAGGKAGQGEGCWATLDCADAFYCQTTTLTCQPAGGAAESELCRSTADCRHGLTCQPEGIALVCKTAAGGTDIGEACSEPQDCLAGLTCSPNPLLQFTAEQLDYIPEDIRSVIDVESANLCVPGELRAYGGVECQAVAENAQKHAFFVMPDNNVSGEFYRLPFPNDVRRSVSGHLDLSGHPTPGDSLGFDFAQRYFDAAEEDLTGFSTNPTVYFRFSHQYDGSTVDADSVLFFRLDPESPGYGLPLAREWKISAGKITNYLCPNWMSVRSPHGMPLAGGEQYAVVLTRKIRAHDGGEFAVSPALRALLDDALPADGALKRAHGRYTALRRLIAEGHLRREDILNATVFTTQKPQALMPKLREVVRAGSAPQVSDLTLCGPGVTSPCDDGGQRACQNQPGLVELHGRITLPVFQHGTPPYLQPEDGGGVQLDAEGYPLVARSEPVCFALTLPAGQSAPEQGSPLVIFGHGTGGSFTSALSNGVSGAAASLGAATLAIDLPQHGSRKAGSDKSSEELFFNFLNPRAARDNLTQGAADLLSLVHWAESLAPGAGKAFAGVPVTVDPERIALFGHSQGSSHGALMLPHEPGLAAAVLSGLGGDLSLALTHKRSPVDVASLVPSVLLDPESAAPSLCPEGFNCLGANHPVLSILQGFFDPVDAVNFGASLREPPPGTRIKHVLQVVGQADSYSPLPTLAAYARSTGMPLAPPALFELTGVPVAEGAVAMNTLQWIEAEGGAEQRAATQAVMQYPLDTSTDGHFVAFQEGSQDVLSFLASVFASEAPLMGH